MTEDEMVGLYYRLDGHEFEQALGVGDGQGGLAGCSPGGRKESDRTKHTQAADTLAFLRNTSFLQPWCPIWQVLAPCFRVTDTSKSPTP